ncbi:TatD family hydrolase [Psychrobacter sp. AOP22-C1-22]|uniref:TatD family hydrolase n=1 Tax=unclassified Psychrobacter TaxID=196806 RepID=UPI0017884523|nr:MULTISPECIES: TatD family hydrolase [unclassified Psychrobacter]MBE0407197.1 TatD family hydrolase [Psychrobacter sp. FME6]MBE0446122.1 TatD family hydrolase [Psychrobacter sp. FME5]MDN5802283.1 TatD family hydrolase [Psychrobacter sp.]MDN5891092.1 TatD family hydrolase [Psychrobacter sp.]
MTFVDSSAMAKQTSPSIYPLIDTHTHFDAPVFDNDRQLQAQQAYERGVRHLVLVGYLYRHFERLYDIEQVLNQQSLNKLSHLSTSQSSTMKADDDDEGSDKSSDKLRIISHVALGLHPFYIEQHNQDHLKQMAKIIAERRPLAIGEIGLDTFTDAMKVPAIFAKQQQFFKAQLDMAVTHQLPVMLHIRKAHAEALAILKAHDYDAHQLGGIAHSFSGGVQEAKAFVKLGFKLGVTGQVTNPNAKKLRHAIQAAVDVYGIECLVIETDCPDMTPIMCQTSNGSQSARSASSALGQSPNNEWGDAPSHNRNVPANLPWVLSSLSELLDVSIAKLAEQLWHNSCSALQTEWRYPI